MYIHGELGPMLGNQRQSAKSAAIYKEPDMVSQIAAWRKGVALAQSWIDALLVAASTGNPVELLVNGKPVQVTKNPGALKSWRAYLARAQAKLMAATQS